LTRYGSTKRAPAWLVHHTPGLFWCFWLLHSEKPVKSVFFYRCVCATLACEWLGARTRCFLYFVAQKNTTCVMHVVYMRGLARARAFSSFSSPKKTRHVSCMSCTCTTIFWNKWPRPLLLSVDALNLTRYVRKALTYVKNPIAYMVLPTRIMFVRYVSGQSHTYLCFFPDMCVPHMTCACITRHIS
jgi:hypothetical protein